MIHVEMADEQIHAADALTNQFETELTDACSRVKDNDTRPATDFNARRIAATTDR